MPKNINLAAAIDILSDVVKEFGRDHEATSGVGGSGCTYTFSGPSGTIKPVCIIGQVVARFGLLGLIESEGSCVVGGSVWENLKEYLVVSEDAQQFFLDAQRVQDGGVTGEDGEYIPTNWGFALDHALSKAKERREAELLREAQDDYVLRRIASAQSVQVEPLAPWEQELLNSNPWDNHETHEMPF